MRIAFIMLCHKNPDQINMLIDKLLEFDGAHVFIHVDMNHADIRSQIKSGDNIHLLPMYECRFIKWGSVDIVKATLQLIRAVKESGEPFDYIWLVSGQDYPICPADEICKRLYANPGINYIETILQDDFRYNWYRKLYEMAYPSWINNGNVAVKIIKRLYIFLTGGHRRTFSPFLRKRPFSYDFAFGSQWWTLTCEAAFEILEYTDAHPDVLAYFEKSIIPDECFFQTVFMRGPYSENRDMNLTYINWGDDHFPHHRSPEVLTADDADKIAKCSESFCFARKFEIPDSIPLIKRIEVSKKHVR